MKSSTVVPVRQMQTTFRTRDETGWVTDGSVAVRGSASAGAEVLGARDLHTLVKNCESVEAVRRLVCRLNGHFAIFIDRASQVLLAVDRLRSIPLFYSVDGDAVRVSDDAAWIREELEECPYDETAAGEFEILGYVTGDRTLDPRIRHVQAGETVLLEPDSAEMRAHAKAYYAYRLTYDLDASEDELLAALDQATEAAFVRLLQYARGRTIVVPLSGGYDSRVVVLMLKRLGYEDVLTFSYGRPGNRESELSRRIAADLGLKWEFIPYTNQAWARWYHSPEREQYFRFAHALASVPHMLDWPAVWTLKNRRLIPDDSLFVPGHSADLVAGSRSFHRPALYMQDTLDEDAVAAEILRTNYSLNDWPADRQAWVARFRHCVDASLRTLPSHVDSASAFEYWDVRERQAKYIVNSVRVYEFWGHDWWLPFWDHEFVDFWCRAPRQHRFKQQLYAEYVRRLYDDYPEHVRRLATRRETPPHIALAKQLVKRSPLGGLARRLFEGARCRRDYNRHPLAWFGMFDPRQFRQLYTGRQTLPSLMALELLRKISIDPNVDQEITSPRAGGWPT